MIRRYSDYDDEARDVLVRAAAGARAEGSASIGPSHILRGALDGWPAMAATFAEKGVDERTIAAIRASEGTSTAGLTEEGKGVLARAETEALLRNRRIVTRADLLVGVMAAEPPVATALREAGLTPASVEVPPGSDS